MTRFWLVLILFVTASFGRVEAQENRNGFRLDTIYKSGAKRQVVKAPVKKSVPLKSSVSRKTGKWTLSGSCGMSIRGLYQYRCFSPDRVSLERVLLGGRRGKLQLSPFFQSL